MFRQTTFRLPTKNWFDGKCANRRSSTVFRLDLLRSTKVVSRSSLSEYGYSDALDGLVLDCARFFEGSSSIASDVVGCDDDGSTTEDAVEEIGG